jgi:hypothetical protein
LTAVRGDSSIAGSALQGASRLAAREYSHLIDTTDRALHLLSA